MKDSRKNKPYLLANLKQNFNLLIPLKMKSYITKIKKSNNIQTHIWNKSMHADKNINNR